MKYSWLAGTDLLAWINTNVQYVINNGSIDFHRLIFMSESVQNLILIGDFINSLWYGPVLRSSTSST